MARPCIGGTKTWRSADDADETVMIQKRADFVVVARFPPCSRGGTSNNNNNHPAQACRFLDQQAYQATMPKDSATSPKGKRLIKYEQEQYPVDDEPPNKIDDDNDADASTSTAVERRRRRFRTAPVTFEEIQEADEELYLKQHQDDEPEDDDDHVSKTPFRRKSWTFSGSVPSKRSPSPKRKNSSPLVRWNAAQCHTKLNWRPLSHDNLLNLNNLALLPTIPEEWRMLNSPATPSAADTFAPSLVVGRVDDAVVQIDTSSKETLL